MPTPRKGETQSKFISRCIPYVMKEGVDKEEAAGRCHGIWRSAREKKSSVEYKEAEA